MALYNIVVSLVGISVLALMYRYFHKSKSTFLAIMIFGISLTFIIKYIIQSNMGVGVGLGLFGIMSLIRFRESFENNLDIIYLFAGISFAILSAIILNIPLLLASYLLMLAIMVIAELSLNDLHKMTVDIDLMENFDPALYEQNHHIMITKYYLKEVDNYKLRKVYLVYYMPHDD